MLFQQFFDQKSHSFSYLLAQDSGYDAVIIDPVDTDIERYLAAIRHYRLSLRLVIDTHLHADHVTAAGKLAEKTKCDVAMSENSQAKHVTRPLKDGEYIDVDSTVLKVVAAPGHTPDSICLVMHDRVFTGDTLLVGSTGRTDLPGGNSAAQFDCLHNKLLTLPDDFLVYPGHDYLGATASTIGREKRTNPRLQFKAPHSYAECMANLNLPVPRAINYAIKRNLNGGF